VVSRAEVDTEGIPIPDDELATMVFTLKYTPPTDLLNTLNSLVGSTTGARGAAAARSKAFSAVEIRDTMMLIITAKFGLLDYIKKLISILDVEVKEPERIVDIVRVEEADAFELVSIIENFLGQRTAGLRSSRTRSTTTRRTPTARPTGTTARPTTTSPTAPLPGEIDIPTVMIPDYRTNKIIVVTYKPEDLEDIHMLVRELDTRFDIRRLKTRIYRMKFLKAEEVAPVIGQLVGGYGGGLSGQRGLGTSRQRTQRSLPRVSQTRPTVTSPTSTTGAGGQGDLLPTNIVAHEETNSLIIQAEPEEYEEILNILNKIDVRKRQLFLEAALVQVSTSSALNYAIELLAGDPDDESTRVLFESSFGLAGIDAENFNRILPDLSAPPAGAILAVMNRGKFPALVSFFKANTDSEVLATPFILADDNTPSVIDVTETRFVVTTSTVNTATTTNQQGEDAGITLDILPRITSEDSVLLDIALTVSEFGQAATVEVLPPKVANSITAAVTIPDDNIYVIGGLTRENKAKTVSKIPIVGDIPLLGKLFRSEGTSSSQSNLYIFLRAHILTDPDFRDLLDISKQAQAQVGEFTEGLKPSRFDTPEVEQVIEEEDPDAPMQFQRRPYAGYERTRRAGYDPRERFRGYSDDERPDRRAPALPAEEQIEGGAPLENLQDGTVPPATPSEPTASGAELPGRTPMEDAEDKEKSRAFWKERGLEVDPQGESWFVPLRRVEPPTPAKTGRSPGRTRRPAGEELAAR
jgi:general secretion pathway protein D